MPILYACVINKRYEIVIDGNDKKFKSNYQEILRQNMNYFEYMQKKTLMLDDQTDLYYSHEGTWIVAVIFRKPDVTLYEAMKFLDKFKFVITDEDNGGKLSEIEEIQAPDA